MTRWKAAGIHLGLSLSVAALVGSLIYFVWYPEPYFLVAGGSALMVLIMGVDIVLGPLLTLVVYKAGKKSLRFDLAVIALLQLCAFGYGFSIIAAARPVFIVGLVNQFWVVSAFEVADADLSKGSLPEFQNRSWLGPRLVGALPPTDPKEKSDLAFSGIAGRDADKFPKYYVPYEQVADALVAKGEPLENLAKKSSSAAALVDRFLRSVGGQPSGYVYLPLHGRTDSFAMVLSTQTKLPIRALPIDPW